MSEYEHLTRWERLDNYGGPDWSDYYVFLSESRDCNPLTASNFAAGLEMIGGEQLSETDESRDPVIVITDSHWACGWVTWIGIHESATEILEKANEIARSLHEDYPVLDEEDFSSREHEKALERWENWGFRERARVCKAHGVSIFAARRTDSYPPELWDVLITD